MKFDTMKEQNKLDSDDKYVLVSFQSSHHAIRGEKMAESAVEHSPCKMGTEGSDKVVRLIPLPPQISAGCGLVLKLPFSLLQTVLDVFNAEGIAFEDVFIVECDIEKVYTKLSLK